MVEALFYGGVLRFAQSLIQAAPFILAGLLVAGVLRRLLGYENTRKLFGAGSWRSLPQAWAIGMLLPVCSLGVIPVIRELRRAGLAGGTILAFALSAPLFNPLSLLYGLTLSEPLTILAFAFCSLVVVTGVGFLWDRFFPGTAQAPAAPAPIPYGLKRLASVVLVGARESAGGSLGYILVGLTGVALLSFALPPGSLQSSANHDNPWAPLLMAAVATPAYATPMTAMSQLGMMFQHGNSVGAAFTLLALGAGMHLGLIVWMFRQFGPRRTGVWLALLLGVVLGLSYGIERPLYPAQIEPADHTHAFDIYCRPYSVGSGDLAARSVAKLRQDIQPYERYALVLLGAYLLIGLLLRAADPHEQVDAWLQRTPPEPATEPAWYNATVPPAALGAIALAMLVALSIVGCYAYYPPPEDVFEEMRVAQAEALGAALGGERAHAERWIPVVEDWSRKLEVGVYLREWRLSEFHRMKARLVRERLELLEHELAHGNTDEIRGLVTDVARASRRLREAYSGEF